MLRDADINVCGPRSQFAGSVRGTAVQVGCHVSRAAELGQASSIIFSRGARVVVVALLYYCALSLRHSVAVGETCRSQNKRHRNHSVEIYVPGLRTPQSERFDTP